MDKEYFIKSGIAICTAVGIKSGGEKVTAEMFSSKEVFDGLVSVGNIHLKKIEDVKDETKKETELEKDSEKKDDTKIDDTKVDDENKMMSMKDIVGSRRNKK